MEAIVESISKPKKRIIDYINETKKGDDRIQAQIRASWEQYSKAQGVIFQETDLEIEMWAASREFEILETPKDKTLDFQMGFGACYQLMYESERAFHQIEEKRDAKIDSLKRDFADIFVEGE